MYFANKKASTKRLLSLNMEIIWIFLCNFAIK